MPVTKIKRSSAAAPAVGGPNWNTLRVDSDDDLVKVGVGASGTTEKTLVDTDSVQTLTNKTISFPASIPTAGLGFTNATSGTITLKTVAGALGTVDVLLPAAADTLVGKATTDTLTNKTLTAPTINAYTITGTGTIGNGCTITTPVLSGSVSGSYTLASPTITAPAGATSTGLMITKRVLFTENATNTVHTGTVVLPAGAYLHDIQVCAQVLWGGGTASMDVGDTADPNGYFDTIDLKATDLLVNEIMSIQHSGLWGGNEGAYLVAATGRRGPTTTNFGAYYVAGSSITGVVTVGTPGSTAGRTVMIVTYSVGEAIAAVASS